MGIFKKYSLLIVVLGKLDQNFHHWLWCAFVHPVSVVVFRLTPIPTCAIFGVLVRTKLEANLSFFHRKFTCTRADG